jgi:hypothetical protein
MALVLRCGGLNSSQASRILFEGKAERIQMHRVLNERVAQDRAPAFRP